MAAPITTTYTDEEREAIVAHILAELAGGRSVNKILNEDEGMPGSSTFWRWHMDDAALRDNVARARENGSEHHLDECVDIADEATDRDSAAAAKVKIDTRVKLAQMLAPRKYKPGIDITSGGEKLGIAEALAARRAQVAAGGDGNEA